MKRKLPLLFSLLLMLLFTAASADLADDIAHSIHPEAVREQRLDADGLTLQVLGCGDRHTLLITEGSTVMVDNDSALLPGNVLPSWSFTSDVLAWSYQLGSEQVRYRAERSNGYWGDVDVTVTGPAGARNVYLENGRLCQSSVVNGCREELTPIPAPWLTDALALHAFRADMLPLSLQSLPAEAFQPAADQLLNGLQAICAQTTAKGLLLLCDKPNHVGRVLAGCVWLPEQQRWQVTRSTAITTACEARCADDRISLSLGGCTYEVGLTHGGSWGILRMCLTDGDIILSDDHLGQGPYGLTGVRWGAHPWADITAMDWLSLPRTCAEAFACADPTGWAVVSNPNAGDKLHLRQQPDAKAYSLGRYYNGTPMQVLSSSKDWLQVSIGGVTGWMARSFVAQDYAMASVAPGTGMKHAAGGADGVPLYADAHGQEVLAMLPAGSEVLPLGFCGEAYYHVLAPAPWLYGYLAMEDVK